MNSNILIECRNLRKKYGLNPALEDISFSLTGGKIVGLLGPNGSGKTTLIKIANGLLTPTSGEIKINGEEIGVETKKIVSYLPDSLSLPDWMKVSELLKYYDDFFEDFDISKALSMISSLDIDTNAKLKSLSKGTKEKVQLILTMSRNALVYFLDEPIGGVDPATRDYILSTILSNYNENAVVVISTHLISEIEKILDEVIILKSGKIMLQDTVDNIRETNGQSVDELFREVFKC